MQKQSHLFSLNNFLRGIGSILNIYPDPKKTFHVFLHNKSFHSDFLSLKSDWERIGKDFSNIYKKAEENRRFLKTLEKRHKSLHSDNLLKK